MRRYRGWRRVYKRRRGKEHQENRGRYLRFLGRHTRWSEEARVALSGVKAALYDASGKKIPLYDRYGRVIVRNGSRLVITQPPTDGPHKTLQALEP